MPRCKALHTITEPTVPLGACILSGRASGLVISCGCSIWVVPTALLSIIAPRIVLNPKRGLS